MSFKIGFFIPSLNGGGAERVAVNLINAFIDKGFYVDLIILRAEGVFLKNVSPKANITVLKVKKTRHAIIPLKKYIEKSNVDVLISFMNYVNSVAYIANLLAKKKVKLVFTEHSDVSQSLAQVKRKSKMAYILMTLVMKVSYRKADCIIAVSQGVKDSLTKKLGISSDKVELIYNPIDIEKITEMSNEVVLYDHTCRTSRKLIVTVGRLSKEKDHENLILSFNTLLENIDCDLLIIGEGKERANLEYLINKLNIHERVKLIGFSENPYKFMKNSDLFVLSSVREGFGNVLVEAMVCETRIVSTDCPSGPREVLKDGRLGLLVDVCEPKRLAEAMLQSLKSPISNEKLNEYKIQRQLFSKEVIVDKYIKVIDKVF